jgi:fucose 4-O-acetylase-like acetyltransferase
LEDNIQRALPADAALEAAASSTPPPRARVPWLDAIKGLGILLVVIGHTLGGLIDSPAGRGQSGWRDIFFLIYVFHMPLFFLLAGVLVTARIDRGPRRFAISLLPTIAYPYFLWSFIQYSAIFLAGSLVNSPVSAYWQPLARLPFSTISQFWFLYILFFLHAAALLLVPRIGSAGYLALSWSGKLLAAAFVLPTLPRLFLIHGAFYALGVWIGLGGLERLHRWLRDRGWIAALAILAALFALLATWWLTVSWGGQDLSGLESAELAARAWRLPTVPAALAAMLACILTAMAARGALADGLAYLGRISMTIFVSHVLFIAGARIALTRLAHVQEPALLLAACFAAGIFLPLVVHALAARLGMLRLLGLR